MKQETRFYNILFPVWLLLIYPVGWIFVIIGNFLIDTIVFQVGGKFLKVKRLDLLYKKTIWKAFLLGLAEDLVGSGLLFLAVLGPDGWWMNAIGGPVSQNPFQSFPAFLLVLLVVALCGVLIYWFNRKLTFRKVDLPARSKHILSLYMAIFTAPYLFFLPTEWLY